MSTGKISTQIHRLLFSAGILLCTVLLLLTTLRCRARHVAASQAVVELATCQTIAAEIRGARLSPRTALLQKQSEKQISLKIQLAAQVAEIPDSDILRITPQQGRRQGKSSHVQQPVDVEIRQVTLGQLARFLTELSVGETKLQPTSIRLAAPRTKQPVAGTEQWACELVLTYLVYSPE